VELSRAAQIFQLHVYTSDKARNCSSLAVRQMYTFFDTTQNKNLHISDEKVKLNQFIGTFTLH